MDDGWWGNYELDIGERARWRIGPLQLYVERRRAEWIVHSLSSDDSRDALCEIEVPTRSPLPDCVESHRFVQRATGGRVTLSGRLADRPVVIKPAIPLSVPGGEEVTLYVGSPVWVQVAVGDPPVHLLEIPSHRASDTWVGPNTREGEACYGSRTLAQVDFADCTIRPHRAITEVEVRNKAADTLVIEQIQLPAPLLALYGGNGGVLWTQSMTLTRDHREHAARLTIGPAAPTTGGALHRIGEPRKAVEGNMIAQVFNRLWNF
ncbi:MAG: hypothetical protein WD081_05180 [Gammaproteobacteria bacterium]